MTLLSWYKTSKAIKLRVNYQFHVILLLNTSQDIINVLHVP